MPTDTRESVKSFAVKIDGANIVESLTSALGEIEISLSYDMPNMVVLRFDDDELQVLSGSTFKLGSTIEIQMPKRSDDSLTTVFKGELTAIEPVYERGYRTIVTIRGYDKSHRMSHGTKIRTFQNQKDSDIATTIAGECGLSATVDATSTVFEYMMQYNQSNMAFLHQLARRNGYKVYVDETGKLNFVKESRAGSTVALKWGDNLIAFAPRMTASQQVTEVSVSGWDPKKKVSILGTAQTPSNKHSIGGESSGVTAYNKFQAAKHYEVHHYLMDQSHANKVAQAILDELNSSYVEAEGIAMGDASIVPGSKVTISNINSMFAGTYQVSTVVHRLNRNGYETEFSIEGARPSLMADLVGGDTRHDATTNQTVLGITPALVTNNNDEQGLMRVRVKFPWLSDQEESAWAKIVVPDAGNQRGMLWMPEVNDEVLVAFEHGDIGRPYVIGSVWNNTDKPPIAIADTVKNGKVVQRIIKTRAGHQIILDDNEGEEVIKIIEKSSKNFVTISTKDNKISITTENSTSVNIDGQNKTITANASDGAKLELNGNSKSVTLDSTSGNIEVKGTNITIKGTGNINVEATGNLTLKGSMVSIQAQGNLSAQASGIASLKGSLVNIN